MRDSSPEGNARRYQRGEPITDRSEEYGCRVALGGYPPRAPTDPYVLALEHTVLQVTLCFAAT